MEDHEEDEEVLHFHYVLSVEWMKASCFSWERGYVPMAIAPLAGKGGNTLLKNSIFLE